MRRPDLVEADRGAKGYGAADECKIVELLLVVLLIRKVLLTAVLRIVLQLIMVLLDAVLLYCYWDAGVID